MGTVALSISVGVILGDPPRPELEAIDVVCLSAELEPKIGHIARNAQHDQSVASVHDASTQMCTGDFELVAI